MLLGAGIVATFVAAGGAAAASLVLLGTLLLIIALMKRVPLSFEVAGAKFDASYEDRAYEAGREGGLQTGVEASIAAVEKAAERGEPLEDVLRSLNEQLVSLSVAEREPPAPPIDWAREERYTESTACAAAGVTPRQLDYWIRTGLINPSNSSPDGSRPFGFRDVFTAAVAKRLLDAGISMQMIRIALSHAYDLNAEEMARYTLISDGVTVVLAEEPKHVADLIRSGRGLFLIYLGEVQRSVAATLGLL